MIGSLCNLIGAIWEMLRVGWISRFRLSGKYWGWRMHTAFPSGSAPGGARQGLRLAIEYFMWVHRIRRLR